MRFYESRGDVTRVTRTGERELSVEATSEAKEKSGAKPSG